MSDILPDCMMPDGGDPCAGFRQLYGEHASLDADNLMLRYRITALENHIKALGFGFDNVEPKDPRNRENPSGVGCTAPQRVSNVGKDIASDG